MELLTVSAAVWGCSGRFAKQSPFYKYVPDVPIPKSDRLVIVHFATMYQIRPR